MSSETSAPSRVVIRMIGSRLVTRNATYHQNFFTKADNSSPIDNYDAFVTFRELIILMTGVFA